MRADEVGPTHLLTTLGNRSNTMVAQDVTYGLIGDTMTQIVQCAGDAIVSPPAILTSHADDEFSGLTSNGRSTRREAVPRAIELLSDQLAKPGQDCVWLGSRRTVSSPRRPSRLPMTARVERSGSVNREREDRWARRILFSASRYSLCSRSC